VTEEGRVVTATSPTLCQSCQLAVSESNSLSPSCRKKPGRFIIFPLESDSLCCASTSRRTQYNFSSPCFSHIRGCGCNSREKV